MKRYWGDLPLAPMVRRGRMPLTIRKLAPPRTVRESLAGTVPQRIPHKAAAHRKLRGLPCPVILKRAVSSSEAAMLRIRDRAVRVQTRVGVALEREAILDEPAPRACGDRSRGF